MTLRLNISYLIIFVVLLEVSSNLNSHACVPLSLGGRIFKEIESNTNAFFLLTFPFRGVFFLFDLLYASFLPLSQPSHLKFSLTIRPEDIFY
jgi:hypothetical protein